MRVTSDPRAQMMVRVVSMVAVGMLFGAVPGCATNTKARAAGKSESPATAGASGQGGDILAGPRVKASDEPQVKIVNRMCPISGTILPQENGLFDQSLTRQFKGKTVGFCCTSCPRAWDALSDDDKSKALDEAMAPSEMMPGAGKPK